MRVVLAFCALLCLASAGSVLAQPTGCTPVAPGVRDGTFEAADPWPLWTVQSSTAFGTPICSLLGCGDGGGSAAPFAGSNWAWFGGTDTVENSTLGQTVIIPPGPFLFVRFQLRIGAVSSPFSDTLQFQVDGTPVATFAEPATPEATYTERYVNVTAFANGAAHALRFVYAGPTTGIGSFTADNVELVSCTTPVDLLDYRIE